MTVPSWKTSSSGVGDSTDDVSFPQSHSHYTSPSAEPVLSLTPPPDSAHRGGSGVYVPSYSGSSTRSAVSSNGSGKQPFSTFSGLVGDGRSPLPPSAADISPASAHHAGSSLRGASGATAEKTSRLWMWVAVGGLAVVGAAATWFYFTSPTSEQQDKKMRGGAAATTPTANASSPTGAAPTQQGNKKKDESVPSAASGEDGDWHVVSPDKANNNTNAGAKDNDNGVTSFTTFRHA